MKQAESGIRKVKWYEWSKFKKSMKRNLDETLQISQTNFLIRPMMFLWFRLKAENYFYLKNGEIAGILSLGTNRGDQVFIYAIAVEPSFRKQGVGKALMDFSEERAAELNKSFLALVVLHSNVPAISLYKKYDYNIIGVGTTYLLITVDKIQTNDTSTLELMQFNINENDLMSVLDQFILGEIEAISGKEGLEYYKQIDYSKDYPLISKAIEIGKKSIYLINNEDISVGFLLISDNKDQRTVEVYSQDDTWNVEFLNNLSSALMELPSPFGEINTLGFKLSICKVERIENLDQTDFTWNLSKNKLLMAKPLLKTAENERF